MTWFRDLESKDWIYAKGALFLALAMVAGGLLLLRTMTWQSAVLLAICVWASCRAYYFAFYVIEHYVDPGFRFSGLIDFGRYLIGRQADNAQQHRGGNGD